MIPVGLISQRTSGLNIDPSLQTLLDYGTTQGQQLPTGNYLNFYNSFIKGIKAFGVWDKLDYLNIYLGDGSLNFKKNNVVDPTKTTTIVGGLVSGMRGVAGNGVDGYIDTGIFTSNGSNSTKLTQNDATRFAVVVTPFSGNFAQTARIDGVNTVNDNSFLAATTAAQRINQGNTSLNEAVDLSGIGFRSISRQNATEVKLKSDSQDILRTANSTSTTISSAQLVFKSGSIGYANLGLSIYGFGAYLTEIQLENTRKLYNSLIDNLGLPKDGSL